MLSSGAISTATGSGTGNWNGNYSYWNRYNNFSLELELCSFSGKNLGLLAFIRFSGTKGTSFLQ